MVVVKSELGLIPQFVCPSASEGQRRHLGFCAQAYMGKYLPNIPLGE